MPDKKSILAYCLIFVTIGLASCNNNPKSSFPNAGQPLDIASPAISVSDEIACEVEFVPPRFTPESCSIDNLNPAGTYRFLSVCSVAGNKNDIDLGIYIEDINSKINYQILSNCFLNYRPVVQNKWISDDLIGFIIWSNPHYGFYFEVNVQAQNLDVGYPVSDQPNAPPIPIQ